MYRVFYYFLTPKIIFLKYYAKYEFILIKLKLNNAKQLSR